MQRETTEKGSIRPLPRRRFSPTADPHGMVSDSRHYLPDGRQLVGGDDDGQATSSKALTLLCR